ncbi:protein lifeguard 1 [Morone saxatilis]|uniref:protein lifeguard 1 n=1 Tax=Morone saxatilis TaxID=34816 RepID=UPI0015E1C1C8|nr:protein lifeguard 1 [Morone saxatilis]
MSDAAEPVASTETKEAPGPDVSSSPPSPSPPYPYEEQQPPPYSAAPEMYPELKVETAGTEFLQDVVQEALDPDTSPPITSSAFDDKTVRRAFVRKVFCILTIQLLFTFSVVCVFTFSSAVKEVVQKHLAAYISSFVLFLVVAIALICFRSLSRRHPWNIVGLVLVTLSLSYMVGTVASFHDTNVVIITMGATLAISLAIIIFSAQTRYDFTICYGILLILLVDLLMFGFFSTFYYSYMADIAYGCLGALLYSLFLMIDCQMLMGTSRYSLDPEDYINAALMIYLDIVLIFLYLLGRR